MANEVLILIIHEDRKTIYSIKNILLNSDYKVIESISIKQGLKYIKQLHPDLVIIACSPDTKITPEFRQNISFRGDQPAIVISPNYKASELDQWLLAGFEDYLPITLEPGALLSKVEFVHQNFYSKTQRVMTYGDLKLDTKLRIGYRGERKFHLSYREYYILKFFMQNPEQIHTKKQILNAVWGLDYEPKSNVMEAAIYYLRRKITQEGEEMLLLNSIEKGYLLKAWDKSKLAL